MSINSQTRSAGPYTGTGLVSDYPFSFKVFETSDVVVIQTDTSDAVSTLVMSVHYTVALNADQDANPGGVVSLTAPLTAAYRLDITSSVALTQPVTLTNLGGFFPKVIEAALDRLTILVQQLGIVGFVQALRVPETGGIPALPARTARANKVQAYDSNGDPVVIVGVDSGSAAALDLSLRSTVDADNGAGQIGANSSLAYAAGTVGAKLAETISVEEPRFAGGASPSRTASENTAAIQAALSYAQSHAQGARILFPRSYSINDTLTFTYTAEYKTLQLEGYGLVSKLTWLGGSNKPMLHIRGTSGSGWNSHTKIEGLYFYGNSYTADAYSGVVGVQLGDTPQDALTGVCNVTIKQCLFHRLGTGILGYYESDQVWIQNNWFKFFTAFGIYNNFGGSGWSISDNHITDGASLSTGIRSSLSVTTISGNVIQGSQILTGVQIDGGTVKQGKCAGVVGNYFESQLAGGYGVIFYGVQTGEIKNNTFNGFAGATLIALQDVDGQSCIGVEIGTNRHTQSGGFISGLVAATSGTTNCTISGKQYTDGAVTTITGPFGMAYSDNVVSVGSGVKFPATQVPSSDAYTLDDYREGSSVSIGLKFGATAQTVTQTVGYTRIGRIVHVSGVVAMAGAVSGTGVAVITGLPFATAAAAAGGYACASLSLGNVTYTGTPSGFTSPASTEIALYTTTEAGSRNQLTQANFASNSEIEFSLTYTAA